MRLIEELGKEEIKLSALIDMVGLLNSHYIEYTETNQVLGHSEADFYIISNGNCHYLEVKSEIIGRLELWNSDNDDRPLRVTGKKKINLLKYVEMQLRDRFNNIKSILDSVENLNGI